MKHLNAREARHEMIEELVTALVVALLFTGLLLAIVE